jgi:hypothetical protein
MTLTTNAEEHMAVILLRIQMKNLRKVPNKIYMPGIINESIRDLNKKKTPAMSWRLQLTSVWKECHITAENTRNYGKPSLIRINFGGVGGQVIRITEAKVNPKRQKKNITQINENFNDISSADENK